MRLPVNPLLYLASLGLLGVAGWFFYQATEKLGAQPSREFSDRGQREGIDTLARGKSQGPSAVNWTYVPQSWWQTFRDARFTGKLPPPPPETVEEQKPVEPPKPVAKPLDQIIDLISLMYDPEAKGAGGDSHIVVRYKPEANVQPPEDVMRRFAAVAAGPGPRPGDIAAQPVRQAPPTRTNQPRPATPMPITPQVREYVHHVKAGESLWPPYDDIKLVRVADHAESAFFVRKPPAAAAPGAPAEEPKEEELIKSSMQLNQEVLKELLDRRLRGTGASGTAAQAPVQAAATGRWVDVEETQRIDNVYHVGRADQRNFQDNFDSMMEQVNLDPYQSRVGTIRGLKVANIDPKLGARFGVQQGDVLLSVNNEEVRNRSEAMAAGKRQYKRGVRTFVTRWLAASGQIVERTYQAPDR